MEQIKMFGLINRAIIVGEILSETKAVVKLRHPGWYSSENGRQSLYPVVPAILPEFVSISASIKLERVHLLYECRAPLQVRELYEKVREKIRQASTGVTVATAADLAKIVSAGR